MDGLYAETQIVGDLGPASDALVYQETQLVDLEQLPHQQTLPNPAASEHARSQAPKPQQEGHGYPLKPSPLPRGADEREPSSANRPMHMGSPDVQEATGLDDNMPEVWAAASDVNLDGKGLQSLRPTEHTEREAPDKVADILPDSVTATAASMKDKAATLRAEFRAPESPAAGPGSREPESAKAAQNSPGGVANARQQEGFTPKDLPEGLLRDEDGRNQGDAGSEEDASEEEDAFDVASVQFTAAAATQGGRTAA